MENSGRGPRTMAAPSTKRALPDDDSDDDVVIVGGGGGASSAAASGGGKGGGGGASAATASGGGKPAAAKKAASKKAKKDDDGEGKEKAAPKKKAPVKLKPFTPEDEEIAKGASMERNARIVAFLKQIAQSFKDEAAWFKVAATNKAVKSVEALTEPIRVAAELAALDVRLLPPAPPPHPQPAVPLPHPRPTTTHRAAARARWRRWPGS